MKRFFITMMAAISTMLGCQAQSFRSVEVEEFEKIIADSAVVRLDVRTDKEFAEGHIAGAICIDVLQEDFLENVKAYFNSLPMKGESEGVSIALYCRSGHRSKKAAGILAGMGYTVVELNSGWLGWTAAGKEIEK